MQEKVNVLHIIKSLGRGGAEMLLPETLKLHDQNRFQFSYIYFLPWKDQMVKSIQQSGGRVTCFRASNNLLLMLKARQVALYVRDHKIQLIHAHLPWAGILARIVGKMTGVPVIYTEHNKQERYHLGTRLANLATMPLLRKVVAVSGDVAESIQRNKPSLKVPIKTILNGVNVADFDRKNFDQQEIRSKLGIAEDALVIGTIAVFRFQKRLDLWLDLASKISHVHKNAHFVLVGDGPLNQELISKRKDLGLEHRVHMPGLQTEVRPYLAAFDIYMMSSIFEGLPIALLEAMAMQCAVISTDAGGIKEVIRHEVDGLLCGVNEPEKLLEYVRLLTANKEQRLHYGTMARKRVVESFSMEEMVGNIEKVYEDTLSMS